MYVIGAASGQWFESDTISSDPSLTTFATLDEALAEIQEVITHSVEMWGERMTAGAIQDTESQQIVWRQQ